MDGEHFWNLLAKKLSGEASTEEKTELENLLKAHPDLHFPAKQITGLWQTKAAHRPEADEAFQNHRQKLQGAVPEDELPEKPRRKIWIASFTLFVLLAAGGWFLATRSSTEPAKPLSQKAEISTQKGDRTKLVLPDSSEVWLNAGSKLTYEPGFGTVNRITTLVGEAFFDVKRSTMPFFVHAGGVQIKVLGTAFNVKSYPGDPTTETSLIRGRVEVTLDKRPGEPIILKPSEKLIVANNPGEEKRSGQKAPPIVVLKGLTPINDSLLAETSWVENKLVFADETFEEVARKMERWYNVTIAIKDEGLTQLHVGGGPFETETIGQALSALQIAFDFKFTIKGTSITITR